MAGAPAVIASALARWRRQLGRIVAALSWAHPVLAGYGDDPKKQFLAAYPAVFKFLLFWWCVLVFAVMAGYILDRLMFRRFGPARVDWSVEHVFKAAPGGRKALWVQLVDPTAWSPQHPVYLSADVRMVRCGPGTGAPPAAARGAAARGDGVPVGSGSGEAGDGSGGGVDQGTQLRHAPLGPLAAGLGLILRHKQDAGPRAGRFFCARECVLLEAPAGETDRPWRLVMRTVEVGAGYPFEAGSEETEVELWPPADDGSVRCTVSGLAAVSSRVFRWWTALEPTSRASALAMLEAVGEEVLAQKKAE